MQITEKRCLLRRIVFILFPSFASISLLAVITFSILFSFETGFLLVCVTMQRLYKNRAFLLGRLFFYPPSKSGWICFPSNAAANVCGIAVKSATMLVGFFAGSSCPNGTK